MLSVFESLNVTVLTPFCHFVTLFLSLCLVIVETFAVYVTISCCPWVTQYHWLFSHCILIAWRHRFSYQLKLCHCDTRSLSWNSLNIFLHYVSHWFSLNSSILIIFHALSLNQFMSLYQLLSVLVSIQRSLSLCHLLDVTISLCCFISVLKSTKHSILLCHSLDVIGFLLVVLEFLAVTALLDFCLLINSIIDVTISLCRFHCVTLFLFFNWHKSRCIVSLAKSMMTIICNTVSLAKYHYILYGFIYWNWWCLCIMTWIIAIYDKK